MRSYPWKGTVVRMLVLKFFGLALIFSLWIAVASLVRSSPAEEDPAAMSRSELEKEIVRLRAMCGANQNDRRTK